MRKLLLISFGILAGVQLFAQPVISSFSPLSGVSGSVVSIQGKGFGQTASTNIIFFGPVRADVLTASDTLLKVYVPKAATFQPITVTVNGLTAYSANSFIVTNPGNSEGSFNAGSFLPGVNIGTGIYPHSVTFGDFNNDGKIDMLVSKGSSASVAVYANTSTEGKISFGPQLDLPGLGSSHEGAAVADFDGDGKPDIVIANSFNTPSVSVYRNTSTGGYIVFDAKIDFAADKGPYQVATGDIDGDGKPDMIVANNGSNVLSFYKNTGSPGVVSFNPKVDFDAGTNPYSIVVRDLDGDGKPDLVVTTQGTSSSMLVMQNTTTGGLVSFSFPETVASLSGSFIASVGDLDGDSIPDMAAASSSGSSIIVVKNMSSPGHFSFYTPRSFSAGNYPVGLVLTDLDGDGKPDMVSANRFSNDISILRNTSSAGNLSFESHVDYPAGGGPFFAASADLDGDGRPDIVCANSSENFVTLFKNSIGAYITPVIDSFTPDTGINGTVVKIKGSNFTDATSVQFGNTNAASFTIDSSKGITAIVGAGVTGAVSVTTPTGTATLAGFTFTGAVIKSFYPTVGVAGSLITITGVNFSGASSVKFGGEAAASFTVDPEGNSITAVVGAGSGGSVEVTTANGTATLPGFSYGAPFITAFSPSSAFVGSRVIISGGNFNTAAAGNIVFFGAVKAVVDSASGNQLMVTVPTGATYMPLSVTTNNLTAFSSEYFTPTFAGDGAALSKKSYASKIDYGTGNYPAASAVSDLDGDGKPDLIIVNSLGNNITILKNTGSGPEVSFNLKTDLGVGSDPKNVAIGDLDGDGKPDIVVVNFNAGKPSTITVFHNTSTVGALSFDAGSAYSSGDGSFGLAIADMNADGKPDVIVSSGNSGFISIFINSTLAAGTISFLPRRDFIQLNHPDGLAVADFDKDGLPDLVTANFSGGNITVYRNQSYGGVLSLSSPRNYAAGVNASSVTTADVDGDGNTDILVTNYSSNNVMLFKNTSTPGSVSFLSPQILPLSASNISVADLNGDGLPDLACGIGLTGIASILQNTTDRGRDFSFNSNVDFTTGNYDTYANAADLTGDGIPELIITNTTLNTVSILKNITGLPEILSLSSTTGRRYDTIMIKGRNFNGSTSVTFGSTPALSFQVLSPTQIRAVVDGGSSGNVEVTNRTGSASYAGFKFIPQISANGPLEICKGRQVTLFSSASSGNQWLQNGVAISGATNNSLEVTTAGTYSVSVNNNGITTRNDSDVVVKLIPVTTPSILKNENNILVSSAASGNRWYLNDILINGANQPLYTPTQVGSYTLQTDSSGCLSEFSSPFAFSLSGIINLGNNKFINLYPNPVEGKLFVNWDLPNSPSLSIMITDVNGNKVFVNKQVQNNTTLNLSQLGPGIYIIKFYNGQLKIDRTTKIIKR